MVGKVDHGGDHILRREGNAVPVLIGLVDDHGAEQIPFPAQVQDAPPVKDDRQPRHIQGVVRHDLQAVVLAFALDLVPALGLLHDLRGLVRAHHHHDGVRLGLRDGGLLRRVVQVLLQGVHQLFVAGPVRAVGQGQVDVHITVEVKMDTVHKRRCSFSVS